MICKKSILIPLLVLLYTSVYSQKEQVKNLQDFDHHVIHFGFLLGGNSSDFVVTRFPPTGHDADSLLTLEPISQSGFNLGIVSALHFSEFFSVRFTPNLAFAQRNLEYTFLTNSGSSVKYTKIIESTFLNFPINIKYKSARLNNFSAYIIGGAAYTLDLASDEDVVNRSSKLSDVVVKLGGNDVVGQLGFGTDFYLPYFKFGIELKMSYGIGNLIVRDDTVFSNPIDKLRSKVFLLSFTFEG